MAPSNLPTELPPHRSSQPTRAPHRSVIQFARPRLHLGWGRRTAPGGRQGHTGAHAGRRRAARPPRRGEPAPRAAHNSCRRFARPPPAGRPACRPGLADPAGEGLEYVVHEAVTDVVVHPNPRLDRVDPGTPRTGDEADRAPTPDREDPHRAPAPSARSRSGPGPGPRPRPCASPAARL